jgi:hypothetical protein
MSVNLPAPRSASSLTGLPKAALREITAVRGVAAISATQAEAITYVAHVGLYAVAHLSETETQLIRRTPLAEPRLRVIGDAAAAAIANVVDRLGF